MLPPRLRKVFHKQLQTLWQNTPALALRSFPLPEEAIYTRQPTSDRVEYLAQNFLRNGYHYVPLVTKDLIVSCGLDMLFLRKGAPGEIIKPARDIDNRLKALLDGLTMPTDASQLGKYTTPDEDEDPFYCLLQDDALVSRLSVETDTLLQPIGDAKYIGVHDARLIITVTVRPAQITWSNIAFG
jgi:hypothetical protein